MGGHGDVPPSNGPQAHPPKGSAVDGTSSGPPASAPSPSTDAGSPYCRDLPGRVNRTTEAGAFHLQRRGGKHIMASRCHRRRAGLSIVVLLSGMTLMVSLVQAVHVQLAWDPSSSSQVTGYLVHYGTASGNYSVNVDTGPATTVALSGLVTGQTYYFAATAYDGYGDQSPFSNEVRYTLPAGDTTPPT